MAKKHTLSTKTYTFYLLFFITITTTFGQSSYFDIYESPGFNDGNGSTNVKAVYTTTKNEVAIARFSKKNLLFEVYNDTGKKIFNQFKILEKNERFISQLHHGNFLKIFTLYSPRKTEREINCYILDISNKSIKKINLFKTVVQKKQSLFSGQNKRQTNWAISPNSNYFVFATDNIKKNANSYKIHVYDTKLMAPIYNTTFLENTSNYFTSYDIAIDNDAKVYALGKEYLDGRKEVSFSDGIPNYEIILHKIDKENVTLKRIKLKKEEHISDLRIIQKEKKLHIYGLYSKERAGRITGLYKLVINKPDLEIAYTKNSTLPTSIFSDLYKEEKIEKSQKKELRNYYLDYVLEDNQGNTILLAEQFYITQTYMNNGMNGGYMTTTLHYDDILVVKLNNEGDIVWGRSILKRGNTPSYNAFVLDNNLHVLLNTGKKLKVKEDGRVKASKGLLESTSLYDYIYDETGKVTQEKIRDNAGRSKFIPFFGNYHNGKFIMFNKSKGEKKVMILTAK